MTALGAESRAIEEWLASPTHTPRDGKDTLRERLARRGDLTWQLARLEAEWLEVSEALDRLDA